MFNVDSGEFVRPRRRKDVAPEPTCVRAHQGRNTSCSVADERIREKKQARAAVATRAQEAVVDVDAAVAAFAGLTVESAALDPSSCRVRCPLRRPRVRCAACVRALWWRHSPGQTQWPPDT